MPRSAWTEDDIPEQSGKRFVVTGANSGLGFETTRALCARGAEVVMGCRSLDKGNDAAAAIRELVPSATLEVRALDLANLASVREFASGLCDAGAVNGLINNAGIMAIPRRLTADGFEMQLGTNHLGHFALTGLLMPALRAGAARVVTVSSLAHHAGQIRFDDLQGERRYQKWLAYGQSKLANLLFAFELQRRLGKAESPVISVAAHPGYSATNLQYVAGQGKFGARFRAGFWRAANAVMAQSAAQGASPQLYAATAPDVSGSMYFGPSGLGEIAGPPTSVGSSPASRDAEVAARLWTVSEQLTEVRYELT